MGIHTRIKDDAMAKYAEFDGRGWTEDDRPRLKRVAPKAVRGMQFDGGMSAKEARKENRELRKRMARRLRRLDKRDLLDMAEGLGDG